MLLPNLRVIAGSGREAFLLVDEQSPKSDSSVFLASVARGSLFRLDGCGSHCGLEALKSLMIIGFLFDFSSRQCCGNNVINDTTMLCALIAVCNVVVLME